jgi:hypothetical protein
MRIRWRVKSRCAAYEQDGDAVEDGIAATTGGAADGALIEREGLATDGADEPAEGFGAESGGMRRIGHGQYLGY